MEEEKNAPRKKMVREGDVMIGSLRNIYHEFVHSSQITLAHRINQECIPLAQTGLTPYELEAMAPFLNYVDCRGLDIDESFISLCSNATKLFIKSDKIKKLESLPPKLQELDCRGCTALATISLANAPELQNIYCQECTALTTLSLPLAPKLEIVMCSDCTALTSLSLEIARILHCRKCPALATLILANAPRLEEIYCQECTSLTDLSLPETPVLETINCCGCTALSNFSLVRAPWLHYLWCTHTNLRALPFCLGQCQNIYEISIHDTRISQEIYHAILNEQRRKRDAEAAVILPLLLEKWRAIAHGGQNLDISALSADQKMTLTEWLHRLERTKDFRHAQALLANTVCNIIADVLKNKEFQELFFSQAEANNACCEDRAAMSLNEIYTSWKILCTPENLNVMAGVAKTLRLRKELQKLIGDERESVEIFLYYESTLRERLQLVTAIQNMTYSTIGKRDWIDQEKLIKEVETHFFEELIELPVFDKMNDLSEEFSNKLEQLGDCPRGGPNDPAVLDYQFRQGEIMQEWKRKKIEMAKYWYNIKII